MQGISFVTRLQCPSTNSSAVVGIFADCCPTSIALWIHLSVTSRSLSHFCSLVAVNDKITFLESEFLNTNNMTLTCRREGWSILNRQHKHKNEYPKGYSQTVVKRWKLGMHRWRCRVKTVRMCSHQHDNLYPFQIKTLETCLFWLLHSFIASDPDSLIWLSSCARFFFRKIEKQCF